MATNPGFGPSLPDSVQKNVIQYVRAVNDTLGRNYSMRHRMQLNDRLYQREVDFSETQKRAQKANETGNPMKMQNVTVPVVMPQIETALDSLSQIFLSSYPIFPVVSKPEMQDAALQMETVIGEESVRFGWGAEILGAMRDGLKHNICAVEVDWQEKRTWTIGNNPQESVKQGTSTEVLFAGNSLKRIDPYNIILDTRVQPFDQHTKGEFVGYVELVSAIQLKQDFEDWNPLFTMNAKAAFESGNASASLSFSTGDYFIPSVNPNALLTEGEQQGAVNWDVWARMEAPNQSIKYANSYKKTTLYARILPAVFGIAGKDRNRPQIYKFVVINDQYVVYAQRQSNAHNYLPIIVAQATEDGLSWQAKSMAENAAPFQHLATALVNSALSSQRKKVYDRIYYDPTMYNKADMDKASEVARIPIKTESYGRNPSEGLFAMPYRDEGVASILSFSREVVEMGNIANGQNRVQQGQFQKGNKTRTEFQETMANSDSRPRMTAIVLENRFFTPLKEIIKCNILQYQPSVALYNRQQNKEVQVDPVKLRRTSLEFKLADGLMPTSQLVNPEAFQTLIQGAAQNPMLAQEYDITGAYLYWLKLQGATWINDFKRTTPMPIPGQPPNATIPPQ